MTTNIATLVQLLQLAVFLLGGAAGVQKVVDAIKALGVRMDGIEREHAAEVVRTAERLGRLEAERFSRNAGRN